MNNAISFAIGFLLAIPAFSNAQTPILLATKDGVEAWSIPQSLPDSYSDDFSATKLVFRTASPDARIATFEGINLSGDVVQTWSAIGDTTVVGPTVKGRPPETALYVGKWADLDSHLLFTDEMIAGGVYELTELNDLRYGASLFEEDGMELSVSPQSGIGSIQMGPQDAFFLAPEFQGNEVELAHLVTPTGGSTELSIGVLGAGFSGDVDTQTEARFENVKIRFSQDPATFFCASSLAATCIDFEANPTDEGVALIGDAQWRQFDGLEDSGYLSLTDAVGDQRGVVVFPGFGIEHQLVIGASTGETSTTHDVDNLQFASDGEVLSFSAQLRIGGGDSRPSDGLSFNFVASDDPLLSGSGDGFAGIDQRTNLPEEGSTTGLSIAFDEWQNGPGPDPSTITTSDIVGISVRLNGKVVTVASLPTLNGELEDVTSLQTGPPRFGGAEELGWAEFTLQAPISILSRDPETLSRREICESLDVTWKGQPVGFFPCPEPKSSMLSLGAMFGFALMRRDLRARADSGRS